MLAVAFVRPEGMYGSFFNRIAAFVTRGKYCHCEIAVTWTVAELRDFLTEVQGWQRLRNFDPFVHDGKVTIAFYILYGTRVSFKFLSPMSLDRFYCNYDSTWDVVPQRLSFADEKKTVRFLLQQMQCQYDSAGAWLYWIPLRRTRDRYSKYFCSQLVACALNHTTNCLPNPASLSPNGLYKHLLS